MNGTSLLVVALFALSTADLEPGQARVTRGVLIKELTFTGDLRASESVLVSSPRISGQWNFLITHLAPEGTTVQPGDLLVQFDASELLLKKLDLEKQLREARLKVSRKEAELEARKQDLLIEQASAWKNLKVAELYAEIDPRLIPRSDAEKYEYDLSRTRLEVEKAKERLENLGRSSLAELEVERLEYQKTDLELKRTLSDLGRLTIHAQSPGLVLYESNWQNDRKFQVGDKVFSGNRILQLPDMSRVEILAQVHDADFPQLELGMGAEVTLDAFPERRFSGRITEMAKVAKARWRRSTLKTFLIRVVIDEPDLEIMRPGMTARVRVALRREDQLLVPREAIRLDSQGRSHVVKEEGAERVPVRILDAGDALAAVEGSLQPGDILLLADAGSEQAVSDDIEWIRVARQDLSIHVSGNGILRAVRAVDIRPPSASDFHQFKIVRMVEEGTEVRAGDFLVAFDPSDIEKRLRQEQASLEKVREEYDKTASSRELQEKDLQLRLEEARVEEEKARNRLRQARQFSSTLEIREAEHEAQYQSRRLALLESKLAFQKQSGELQLRVLEDQQDFYRKRIEAYQRTRDAFVVTAPIPGVVIYQPNWNNEKKQVGSQVWMMESFMALPDLSSLHVEGQISEVDAARVSLGQQVTLNLDALPEETFRGSVAHISDIFQEASPERPVKVLKIQVALEEIDNERMRPGMATRLRIAVESLRNVLALPLSVIQSEDGGFFVWVRGNDGPARRQIEIGHDNGLVAVVESGLVEGEEVVSRPWKLGEVR